MVIRKCINASGCEILTYMPVQHYTCDRHEWVKVSVKNHSNQVRTSNIRPNSPKQSIIVQTIEKWVKFSIFFYKIVKNFIFTIPFGISPHIVFLNHKLEKLISGAMIHKITIQMDQVNIHAIFVHLHALILIFGGHILFLWHPKNGVFSQHRKSTNFHVQGSTYAEIKVFFVYFEPYTQKSTDFLCGMKTPLFGVT